MTVEAWAHPDDLQEHAEPHDVLRFLDGSEVGERWEMRQAEIRAWMEVYEYGRGPAVPEVNVTQDGEQLTVDYGGGTIRVWLRLPEGGGPVLLGVNKCGNAAVNPAGQAPGWVEQECGDTDDTWFVDDAVAAGVGVATFHQSDVHPDDASQRGIRDDFDLGGDPANAWAAVATWSWGLSVAMSALETLPDVGDVYVWGHSRRGKAALWAAANDARFAGVWSHQSGTAGSAMARSYEGESIAILTAVFPHWFPEWFHAFADRETYLPFDQHLLIASIAPRRVLLTDGDDDAWADPAGTAWSAELAEVAFDTFGGSVTHELRDGDHEVLAEDWAAARAWIAR